MKLRQYLTEDELELLTKVNEEFSADLAKIAAKQIAKFDPAVRHIIMITLQDQTSLFSPHTAEKIYRELQS